MRVFKSTTTVAVSAVLLSGCGSFETRPGHPDSYKVGVTSSDYYDVIGLKEREWPTAPSDATQAATVKMQVDALQAKSVPINQAPPAYIASSVPREIWQARGGAWNLHLKYLAASYKAEEIQDLFAVPLFGAAIATAALGIAKASTAALAGTGLGGTALYAGYSYAHPDKDAATDQTAAFDLLCVVDQSLPLRTMSAIPLILDKAALLDALNQLTTDSASLMAKASPSDTDKTTQKAVTSAKTAASQALALLDTNINLYSNMPTVIYLTMDKIDQNAQTGSARTIDYPSILSNLKGSDANQTANSNAKTATANAAKDAADAAGAVKKDADKKGAAPSGEAADVTKPQTVTLKANLKAVTSNAAGTAISAAVPSQAAPTTDPGKAGTNQTTATALDNTLTDPTTNDLQKVISITSNANEDIAAVDYHGVAANIQSCTAGPGAAPIVTATPPAAATPDKPAT